MRMRAVFFALGVMVMVMVMAVVAVPSCCCCCDCVCVSFLAKLPSEFGPVVLVGKTTPPACACEPASLSARGGLGLG